MCDDNKDLLLQAIANGKRGKMQLSFETNDLKKDVDLNDVLKKRTRWNI